MQTENAFDLPPGFIDSEGCCGTITPGSQRLGTDGNKLGITL